MFCAGKYYSWQPSIMKRRGKGKIKLITVRSHEPLKSLAIRLYVQQLIHAKITKTKRQGSTLLTLCEGFPPGTGDFLPKGLAMGKVSWRDHVNRCCSPGVVLYWGFPNSTTSKQSASWPERHNVLLLIRIPHPIWLSTSLIALNCIENKEIIT